MPRCSRRGSTLAKWTRSTRCNLIFLLWGSTQHYADFATQICRVSGRSKLTKQDMEDAGNNLIRIILKGCGLTPTL